MSLTLLAAACSFGAAIALAAYLIGLLNASRLRPLPSIGLFFTGMALWQMGSALLKGLGQDVHINLIYASAFLLIAAIGQVASLLRTRRGTERRAVTTSKAEAT